MYPRRLCRLGTNHLEMNHELRQRQKAKWVSIQLNILIRSLCTSRLERRPTFCQQTFLWMTRYEVCVSDGNAAWRLALRRSASFQQMVHTSHWAMITSRSGLPQLYVDRVLIYVILLTITSFVARNTLLSKSHPISRNLILSQHAPQFQNHLFFRLASTRWPRKGVHKRRLSM